MSDDVIGGFLVNLGVKVDNSIEKGIGKITDMTNSLSRLMGTVRNVSAASLALAGVTGAVEQEVANSAALLNTTSDVVKMWRFAVDETGASGKAFISTLTGIESKIQDVKKGVVDEGLATALSRLGINMLDFANMEMTERVKLIFDKADLIKDKKHARDLVGDILGAEGQKFYINLESQGKNLNEVLSSAKNHIFTDIESQSNAMMFNSEIKALKNMIGEISALTGSELGEVFTPMVKGINDFLEANNKLIASGIKDTFEDIRDILNQLSPTFDKVGDSVGNLIKSLTNSDSVLEGLNKIKDGLFEFTKDFTNTSLTTFSDLVLMINAVLDGDWKKAGQHAVKFVEDFNKGVGDMFTPEDEQGFENKFQNYQKKMQETKGMTHGGTGVPLFEVINRVGDSAKEFVKSLVTDDVSNTTLPQEKVAPDWHKDKINDGIVKPNGQVISISPDDWVFAMKDPSNLSKGTENIIPKEINNFEKENNNYFERENNNYFEKEVLNNFKTEIINNSEKINNLEKEVNNNNLEKEINNNFEKNSLEKEINNNNLEKEINNNFEKFSYEKEVNNNNSEKINNNNLKKEINKYEKEINNYERENKFIYEKQLEKNINNIMPQNAIDPSFIKSVLPRTITGNTNTINENITVNQTFNVQGGGNIPQTIRQQAQKGVYDGVGDLIQKSTTRLQLMSGIK